MAIDEGDGVQLGGVASRGAGRGVGRHRERADVSGLHEVDEGAVRRKLQLAVHRAWADVQRSGGGAAERGYDGDLARREYCAEDGRANGGVCVHAVRHDQ